MDFTRFREIVADALGVPLSDVSHESLLLEDLGAESVDVVRIVSAAERLTGESAEDVALDSVRSVKDLYDALATRSTG